MKKSIRIAAFSLMLLIGLASFGACGKRGEDSTDEPLSDTLGSTVTESGSETETEAEGVGYLTCEDHREAYYIIEAVAANGRNGLANGWNYDNRFDLQNTTGRDESVLYDDSDERFYRLIRDFQAEHEGSFRLEMLLDVKSNEGGVYVSLEDGEDNRLFGLSVKGGKWVLKGSEEKVTSVSVDADSEARYAIELDFDLDRQTMSALINNRDCGSVKISASSIARLVLGTEKAGKGMLAMHYVRLSKNYAVNQHFLAVENNQGEQPADWNVTGDFALANIASMRQYDLTSVRADSKAGTTSTATLSFAAVSGKVAFETMILLPEKADGASVSLMSGDEAAVSFETRDGKLYAGDQPVHDYTANVWQTLHIEADTDKKSADIYVNGKKRATVAITAAGFDGVQIAFAPGKDAVSWFDDVEVYNLYDHADYPAEPQVAASDDYNIGVNVCWLWRDQQSGEGWDATAPFSELDPYLGFYDDGLRETADWELKWMAEHGIDFVHVCWYCPSGDIQAPIKEMRHSHAGLHDGYMMAKYSEYVDFCIMWENAHGDCSSFEQFKKYIWSYWVEYYFSDSRYARLDNKAVLTVWSLDNMLASFGGIKGTREAVDFMNEELKKLGYDGIILLASIQGTKSQEYYAELKQMGFDATYGYSWGADGYKPQVQIDANNNNLAASAGVSHHIPTVSIGFNDVARNETRDPIITPADHLSVCAYIKETLSEGKTGTWKDNTLFLSTWNEYSEGTYMAPTASTGYDYLENVRKTFTGDTSDHTDIDVRPTENQIARVSHLYPPNHAPIRWLQHERSSAQLREDPSLTKYEVIRSYDMSDGGAAKAWKSGHALSYYRVKDGILYGASAQSDFSIQTSDRFEAFAAEDAPILHIRMKNDSMAKFEIFFATETAPDFDSVRWKAVDIVATDEFVDYYVNMAENPQWGGKITKIRLDPQTAAGKFEIALIEFLNVDLSALSEIPSVTVNNNKLEFTFDPESLPDGDILVCGKAKKYGFYSAMRLYYEFDRFTGDGVLTLYTFDEKKLIFTAGSDKVELDGKVVDAGFTFTLRDGLPQFHLQKLCRLLGYKYTREGKDIAIQAATDREYNTIINVKPNQWEFETLRMQEGWVSDTCTILSQNGCLVLTPKYPDVNIRHEVDFDASEYTHLVVGILYDAAGKGEGDIVEAVFDLSRSDNFSGAITGIRLDPYTELFEGKIAYIRFVNRNE